MIIQGFSRARHGHHFLTRVGIAGLLGLILILAACGGSSNGSGTQTGQTCPSTKSLTGAGSTFINPLFSKMFTEYPNAKCGANVNYQSVGSGAGINDLLQNIVQFGATDAPVTDAQLAKSTHGSIIHIPATIGAVAISYNLTGVSGHLNLTGPIVANIYLGNIKFWDDAQIKAINSGVTLPHQSITVVHRSDGSGTTGIFTNYLAVVSPDWKSKVGAGTTVNWPTGVGGKGNAGVAAQVKSTAGAIGYNELAYVLTNNIQYASIQNANGKYVLPSVEGAKADADNVTNIPADLRLYIVNAPGDASYPITGFSWAIVYQNQTNADKGWAIANMLWWVTHDGQQYSLPLNYVPLPASIVTRDEAQIKSMMCGSSPCYKG
ncbi:MAG TPA: phosphate ABC transporter substrate-binding protein PstS [Ktedonobacteraceae bacterium]|nr:phosphate ABC transporter substrate-binding protein PstS [Ktedonobacteraceae bacterium]